MIHYHLNKSLFTLGETVTGRCEWVPDGKETGKTAKLTVGWFTEGRGYVDQKALYEAEASKPSQ